MRFVVSIKRNDSGSEMKLGGIPFPVRASYYVDELGAGKPIATAGGQRGSLEVAGPYATYNEAKAEAARREALV